MRRYAEWREAGPGPSRHARRTALMLGALVGYLGLYGLVITYLPMPFTIFPTTFLPFLSVFFTIFLARRVPSRLSDLVTPGPDEIPVAVTLTTPGRIEPKIVASDIGALALVDGWLVFRGERTDWAVRAADVRFPKGVEKRFVYDEAGWGVMIRAFDGWTTESRWLDPMWMSWRAGAVPEGESVFPPRTSPPELRSFRHAMVQPATAAVAVLGALMAMSVAIFSFSRTGIGAPFVLVSLAIVALWAVAAVVRTVVLRRRFRRDGRLRRPPLASAMPALGEKTP